MGVPILGICYGHQLLAATMPGGVVKPSYSREYGLANLQLAGPVDVNGIFAGIPSLQPRVGEPRRLRGNAAERLRGARRRLKTARWRRWRTPHCGCSACSFTRK